MWLDLPDPRPQSAIVARLDVRIAIVAALTFVVAVVSTPIGWWWLLGIEAATLAIVIVFAKIRLIELLRRWLTFVPFVGFLAIMVAMGHPARASLGYAAVATTILFKNSMAFLAVMVLTSTIPFPRILAGMRRLGAPRVLVATLHFMFRYIHVLGDELSRMMLARRSRTFRRDGADWGMLSGLIGVLFLRAMERGERVHAAMLARGWDGTIRSLDDDGEPS